MNTVEKIITTIGAFALLLSIVGYFSVHAGILTGVLAGAIIGTFALFIITSFIYALYTIWSM